MAFEATGNPAAVAHVRFRPVALRPRFSTGLPSVMGDSVKQNRKTEQKCGEARAGWLEMNSNKHDRGGLVLLMCCWLKSCALTALYKHCSSSDDQNSLNTVSVIKVVLKVLSR